MAAGPKEAESGGFFSKLAARMNRGKSWLATGLLGIGSQPLDERTVEDLETQLLTADVGVDATTWLIAEMRTAAKRNPATPAAEGRP